MQAAIEAVETQGSPIELSSLVIGSQIEGGTYTGEILVDGVLYGIITSPKALGDFSGVWHPKSKMVDGAESPNNGRQNTAAMRAAGCSIALELSELKIGEYTDWHLPSRDELEIMYRALKPTTAENSIWSGVNASSVPPQNLYTRKSPAQTALPEFQEAGAEAFEPTWYWTSTQATQASAWIQGFLDGFQGNYCKDGHCRARAVRWIKLSHSSI